MKAPENFTKIINKKRYSTKTATLVADDAYWDGHNYERGGTNTFLYKTKKGMWFTVHLSQWQESESYIHTLTEEEAYLMYEGMALSNNPRISVEEAFPGIEIEDA